MRREGIRRRASARWAQLARHFESNTITGHPRSELVSAFLVAPLVEEAVFRAALFHVAKSRPAAGEAIALLSATLFGLMHRRFGPSFVYYTFVGGLALWIVYARFGYPGAVLVHSVANVVDLAVGWRQHLVSRTGGPELRSAHR